jgi:hypothetical protein
MGRQSISGEVSIVFCFLEWTEPLEEVEHHHFGFAQEHRFLKSVCKHAVEVM